MAQYIRTSINFAEDLRLAPRTNIVAQTTYNSKSRGFSRLFCLLKGPGMHIVHILKAKHSYIKNKKKWIFFFLNWKGGYLWELFYENLKFCLFLKSWIDSVCSYDRNAHGISKNFTAMYFSLCFPSLPGDLNKRIIWITAPIYHIWAIEVMVSTPILLIPI